MKRIDEKEAIKLYDELKEIVLKSRQHKYEKNDYAELEGAYEEKGSTTFKNINGDNITIEIHHFHRKDDWCTSGLEYIPQFEARIFKNDNCIWGVKGVTEWVYRSPYDDDLELECCRFFGDLPRELLKPFKKKKPKKATNRIHVEEPVRDDRTLVDELTKAYENYCNAVEEKRLVLKEKEEKVKQAIETIAKEYSDSINERTKEEENTETQLRIYKDLVTKYSTFNVDDIGEAIASIVSEVRGTKYKFGRVTSYFDTVLHDILNEPFEERISEYDCIVVDTCNYETSYSQPNGKNKVKDLVKDGHAILLSQERVYTREVIVTLLTTDNNGKIDFKINLEKFDYIKDFIIEVAQYRFQRKLASFTKADMNLCVDNFIPKAEQIYINNRIAALQGELKSLKLQLKK